MTFRKIVPSKEQKAQTTNEIKFLPLSVMLVPLLHCKQRNFH